jgi:CHASE2 domain-containing sensor protein
LFAILLAQALRGQPVLNADAPTMETLGVWAVVTAICAWRSVARVEIIGTPELV